jgi:hypothetical protein
VLDAEEETELLGQAEAEGVPAAVAEAESNAGEGDEEGVGARAVGERKVESVGTAVVRAVPVPSPAAPAGEALGQADALGEGLREGEARGLKEELGEGAGLLVRSALREGEKRGVVEGRVRALGGREREGAGERERGALALDDRDAAGETLMDGLGETEGLLLRGVAEGLRGEAVGAATVAVAARAPEGVAMGEWHGREEAEPAASEALLLGLPCVRRADDGVAGEVEGEEEAAALGEA